MDPVSREILDMTEPQGLTLSSPVHYVGLGTRLEDSEATRHFSHFVAQRLLNTDFLWEQVRMQGGAYGCSSSFSHLERTMIFTSYRDPHLTRTLDLYRKSGIWLQQLEISTDALEQTVIGTLGKLSPPERPSTLVTKSFFRHLIGLEHDTRQRFWDDIHQTTPRHLHAFGRALTEALQQTERLCVLGNADGQKKSGIPFRSLQLL
jgi:Zn-dependent M16 (insulinase) family peptidase